MPCMTGLELCRAFRALPRNGYGYFILLTSKSDKEEVAEGLDAGADDFLIKPVNFEELRARLAAGDRIVGMQRELTEKNDQLTSTLDELKALYRALDNDLIEARKLQQSLVSDRNRDLGPAEVSLMLRSCGHVGGDLVGMFPAGEDRLGLYAIDVSGHGVSSALMTARLAGYLSAASPAQNVALIRSGDGSYLPRPPAETVEILNNLVLEEMETEHYFTMLLADIQLRTGRVIMTQAGHPCPALQRTDGTVEMVGGGGLPVGLIGGAGYDEFEVAMMPGDRLLVHSDGLIECPSPEGQLLGSAGLAGILRDLRQTRNMACLDSVIWRLTEFSGGEALHDDVSAILLELKPSPIVA